MLLDVDALAAYQQDPNLDNLLLAKVFRACPIKFVGHTPNGRHIDSTGDMLDSTYCLFESFISKVPLSHKGLHEFDVVQACLKIEKKNHQRWKHRSNLRQNSTEKTQATVRNQSGKPPHSAHSTPHKKTFHSYSGKNTTICQENGEQN